MWEPYTHEEIEVAAYYISLRRRAGEDTGTDGPLGDWLMAQWTIVGYQTPR